MVYDAPITKTKIPGQRTDIQQGSAPLKAIGLLVGVPSPNFEKFQIFKKINEIIKI